MSYRRSLWKYSLIDIVNMGCTNYLLPFLSSISFLDQLEDLLSLPYIPLSILARGSFPDRRGGFHDHGVCVAESGTGLTLLGCFHPLLQ
jgi:hypothetical protein